MSKQILIRSTFVLFFLTFLLTSCQKKNKNADVLLDGKWKFSLSDSPDYAKGEYNDDDWVEIETGRDWESQGFENSDGFAWYRYKVIIPSALKEGDSLSTLQFFLGKIDDNDQVFLNGTLIGENNHSIDTKIPVKDEFIHGPDLYDVNRIYELDIHDKSIRWNGENLIAVRVFDKRNGGGMSYGVPFISSSRLSLTKSRSIELDKGWKFKTGDSLAYMQPGYDDSKWSNIQIRKEWENEGYEGYDGFAWYRLKMIIPNSLKGMINDANGFVEISPGKVDDNDQVYLNGKIIGENNKTLPKNAKITNTFKDDTPMFNVLRSYQLSVNDERIKWGKENVIAVRVFDQGQGGGLSNEMPRLKVWTIGEFLSLDRTKFLKPVSEGQTELDSLIYFKNNHERMTFNGKVFIKVENRKTKATLSENEEPITLRPGATIGVPVKVPYSEDELIVYVALSANNISYLKEVIRVPFALKEANGSN
jgi:hypothetical protein